MYARKMTWTYLRMASWYESYCYLCISYQSELFTSPEIADLHVHDVYYRRKAGQGDIQLIELEVGGRVPYLQGNDSTVEPSTLMYAEYLLGTHS